MMLQKNTDRKNPAKKKIVMAFGTFDFLHAGHEYYLRNARSMGDYLIVVIARDKTVRQIKGEDPVHSERKRAKRIREKGIADKIIFGYHTDKHKVIRKFRPDVIALGYDQYVFTQTLKKSLIDLKLDTVIERIDAHYPQVYKSSLIKSEEKENSVNIGKTAHQNI